MKPNFNIFKELEDSIVKLTNGETTIEEIDNYFRKFDIENKTIYGLDWKGQQYNQSVYEYICQRSEYDAHVAFQFSEYDMYYYPINYDLHNKYLIIPIKEHAKKWWVVFTEKIADGQVFLDKYYTSEIKNYDTENNWI